MSGLLGLVRSTFSADIVRFRDGKFDLDLTYITNDMRVIAMGFPADGIESAFRNNIFELSKMLKERHGAHFMIWNLSGRKYDYDLFDNQILEFPFPDHHNPPLEKLFKIVKSMDSWIKADYQNTCVVHCLAGRGRTGTVISCYLNYSGMFTNAVDALAYFGKKRSMTETGVSQPSQIRYVEYFTHCLKGFMPFPRKKILRMVKFGPLPPFLCTQPLPVIDIYDMSTYPARLLRSTSSLASNSATSEIFSFTNGKLIFRLNDVVQGDVMVTLSSPTWSGQLKVVARSSFNTFFVEPSRLKYTKPEIDKANVDKRFTSDFSLVLKFDPRATEGVHSDPDFCAFFTDFIKVGRMNLTNHKLLNPSEDERLLPVLSSTPPSPQLSKPSRPPPMPRPSHPASVPPSTSPPHPPFTVLTQSASFSTLPTTVVSSTTSSSQSAATVPIPALHASAPLIFSSRTPSPPQNIPPQPPQQQQITSSTPSIETLQTNPIPIILTPSSSPSPLIEPSATTPPPYSSESPTTSNTILLSTTPNNNSTTTITVTKTSSSPPVTIIDNTESITESISTPLPHSPEPVHSLHTSSAGESRLHWSWSSAQMNNTLQLKEKRLSSHKVKSGPAITQPLVEPNTGTGEDL